MENEKKNLTQMMKDHKVISVVVILLILLTLFRIGMAVFNSLAPVVEERETVTVQTTIAGYDDISSTAPITGRIAAAEEVAVVPMAMGKITAVHVKVGDYVTKGTVLFEIDKSQVAAGYNTAKAAYDLAVSTYESMVQLYEEGAISKSAYDQAYVSYLSAQSTFNTVADTYNNYNVSAPIDGYVTSISAEVGNMAGQSMAASIANTDSLKIEASVSEYLSARIHVDDSVEIYVASLGDKAYPGTITALSPAPAYGTLTYPVTITVGDTTGDIKSGMFAEVRIKDQESKNALCIPSDAVITKDGENMVVILDKANVPSYSKVTTGIDNGKQVEITSGVREGDIIVTSGQQYINEGEPVIILNETVQLTDNSGEGQE